MSTSLLHHAFSIRGYEYVRTEYQGGNIVFTIQQAPKTFRCEARGSRDVRPRGRVERRFQSLPIGSRSTVVVLPIPRVACQVCEVVRQVKLEFADSRRTYTKTFERYALEPSRSMTILDVARQLGVSWDIIKDVQKCDLSRRYSKPNLKDLRQIAIDEIAVAKGHRYLAVDLTGKRGRYGALRCCFSATPFGHALVLPAKYSNEGVSTPPVGDRWTLGRIRSHVVMQAVDSVVMTEITPLLEAAAGGDRQAAADLLPLVYDELRKLAAARMAAEKPGHTLDATALVHEAYVRLIGDQHFDGKAHFFAAAAEAMRRALVNHARDRNRSKRGGKWCRVDLDRLTGPCAASDDDLLELDEALDRLAKEFPVAAELAKLRFFAGMTLRDAAEALGLPRRTADRHWAFARAWLADALAGE